MCLSVCLPVSDRRSSLWLVVREEAEAGVVPSQVCVWARTTGAGEEGVAVAYEGPAMTAWPQLHLCLR